MHEAERSEATAGVAEAVQRWLRPSSSHSKLDSKLGDKGGLHGSASSARADGQSRPASRAAYGADGPVHGPITLPPWVRPPVDPYNTPRMRRPTARRLQVSPDTGGTGRSSSYKELAGLVEE